MGAPHKRQSTILYFVFVISPFEDTYKVLCSLRFAIFYLEVVEQFCCKNTVELMLELGFMICLLLGSPSVANKYWNKYSLI